MDLALSHSQQINASIKIILNDIRILDAVDINSGRERYLGKFKNSGSIFCQLLIGVFAVGESENKHVPFTGKRLGILSRLLKIHKHIWSSIDYTNSALVISCR